MQEQGSLGFPALSHFVRKIVRLLSKPRGGPLALPREADLPTNRKLSPPWRLSPDGPHVPQQFPLTGKLSELFRHFLLLHLPSGQRRESWFPFLSCTGEATLIADCWGKSREVRHGALEECSRCFRFIPVLGLAVEERSEFIF